jgi:hypothetical protein
VILLTACADRGRELSYITLLLCLGGTLVVDLLVGLLLLEDRLRDLDVLLGDGVGAAVQLLAWLR